jgi:hypothetical protein
MFDAEQPGLLTDALQLLPTQDSALRAALLARLAVLGTPTMSAGDRAGLADEAAEMARRVGDAEAEVAALAALCDARSGPDFVEVRVGAADRMLRLARGHALIELLARRIRLRARLELGDLVGVDADITGYARIADRLRSPTYGWLVPLWRGMRAVLDGDLTAAARFADNVAAEAETAQSTNAMMMAWALRWRIARLGNDISAMAELSAVIAPWAVDVPAWSCTAALLCAELGKADLARRHLRRVMNAGLDSTPFDSEWVELLWSLGEAALLLDEPETVRAVHAALEPYAHRWAVDGYGGACFGQVADLLSRLRDGLGGPTTEPSGAASFVRTGAVWRLEYRGHAVTVVDSKGLRDLAALLARPGREIHVLDLVEAAGGPSRAAAGSDAGPVIDAEARAAYKRRLVDLEDEIETATRNNDLGRLARLEAEKEFIAAELAAALGLGGRIRIAGDPVERARKAVAMRIGTALKAIETEHPDLARHLRNSVTTGRTCRYLPDHDVDWQLTVRRDIASPDMAPPR